jgi:hypothetical protein
MEVWVQGLGVYAELLADSEFQAVTVGEGELVRERIIKSPGICLGL